MFSRITKSLQLKLLFSLVCVLAVSFAGLSFFILKKQDALLKEMRTQVEQALVETGKETLLSFEQLQSHANELLVEMKQTSGETLSRATQEALGIEEKQIQEDMESLMLKNAEGIFAMLNSITPSTVMRKEYGDLINYSRAAAETKEVVFALFFDKEGAPLPGFLNAKDPRIRKYLSLEEDGTGIEKVMVQAKKDSSVMIFEHPIKYYGTDQGKMVICMNRDTVAEKIQALNQRFTALNLSNGQQIDQALETGSAGLKVALHKELTLVSNKNTQAAQKTGLLLKEAIHSVNSSISQVIVIVGFLCSVLIMGLIGLLLHFMVIAPILRVSDGLKDTAQGEGDLTKRLALNQEDEIGVLASWFDAFIERLQGIILEINVNAGTVTTAAQEVLSDSDQMNQGALDLSEMANSVAAATEEMSANMDSVAAASEQAAGNVKQVADASVQMETTLNEVAESCDRARAVAGNASAGVETASTKVSRLGEAAREISQVTQVITDIAEQTNLLALNATIEAARAGEAGKGFAVVAAEIKDLAAQTAQATQDIRGKIDGIQNSTDETIGEVGRISQVIAEVNQIVTTIAAAVEEQSAMASGVAENVSQASAGINEVNTNVSESSQVSTEIAGDIAKVHTVADTMSGRSSRMKEKAGELSDLSIKLKEMISVFKVS